MVTVDQIQSQNFPYYEYCVRKIDLYQTVFKVNKHMLSVCVSVCIVVISILFLPSFLVRASVPPV